MKNLNYQTGKFGEKLARDYLIKKGYQIVAANFHNRFGEIDIIAAKNRYLVFVEVKAKIGETFGSPEEMADKYKIRRVQQMATVFLRDNPTLASKYPQYRIDAVCLVLDEDNNITRFNHWENLGNEME